MSSVEFGSLYSRHAVAARTVVAAGGSSSGGGLSPVEVCGSSNGAVDMDFGASPPQSVGGGGGSPRCEATAVLSDLSSEITAIEERLQDVDLRGSAVAFTSSSNALATATAPSPMSSAGDAGGVPTTSFSLRSFAKPKPVVSATIEVSPGNNEKILLHDSDTPTSCRALAAKFVEDHQLDSAAIEPLSLHLWTTLKAFLPQGGDTLVAEGGSGSAAPKPETLPGRRPAKASNNSVSAPPGRKVTRQSDAAAAPFSNNTGADLARAGAPVRRQPSTATISEDSPTVTRRSTSGSRQYAHVAPRYQSPAPARPPPPEPHYSHTPQVCKSSVKLVKNLASSSPVYERLHAKDAEIQRKLQHKAAAAMAGTGRMSKEFLNHHVKGCDWMGTSSAGFQNSGHRLYAQAERQQRALSEKMALAQKEREMREVDGATFHPAINPSLRSPMRYRDPYRFDPSASTSSKPKLLSSEELELKQCTFRPTIHKPPSRATSPMNSATSAPAAGTARGYARSPTRHTTSPARDSTTAAPAAVGMRGSVGERSLLSQSPARRVISPVRGTTPTRSATATTSPVRKVSADTTKRPVSPMAPRDVEKMTARLFHEAREREDRIQRTRKLLETIDTKTGKPFFRPNVGKRPPPPGESIRRER